MKVGPYEIVSTLGRGGMGSVFRGRAPDGRDVAIKVLNQLSPSSRARFERERRLLGSLGEAQGFVPLLDAGESAQGPWLAMPLVAGGTLRERLENGALAVDEAVGLVATLTQALAEAHAQGIVHRDLKPENILFTAAGTPLIADLGLAKHFDADAPGASRSVSLSVQGESMGTAGYLAPEQMTDAKNVGPPTDVFALGAILYECFAGQPAFEGATLLEVLAKASTGSFVPLRRACPQAPPVLAAAIDAALAPDPAKRATTADLLAALRGEKMASGRRPLLALALALVAAAGVAFFLLRGATRPRGAAPPPEQNAPATPVAASVAKIVFTPEESAFQKRVKTVAPSKLARLVSARGHDEMRHSLDVRMLAFAKTREGRVTVVSGGADGLLRVWDFETARELAHYDMPHEVRSVAVSADGRFAVVGGTGGAALSFDLWAGKQLRSVAGHRGATVVAISADGKWGASSGAERTLRRWPLEGTAVEGPLRLQQVASFLRFVPDDPDRVFVGLFGGSLSQTSFLNANVVTFLGHDGDAADGDFLPDGTFASIGADRKLRLHRVGEPLYDVPANVSDDCYALAVSPDGKRILTAGHDRRVEIHDAASGLLLGSFATTVAANSIAFHPDGKRLAIAGSGGSIRFLDLAGKDVHPLSPDSQRGTVRGLALSKDGTLLGSASDDGTVKLWDVGAEAFALRATRATHTTPAVGVGFIEAQGKPLRVLSLGQRDGLRLFTPGSHDAELHVATDPEAYAEALAVSADGRHAIVANDWAKVSQQFDVTETALVDRKRLILNDHRAAFTADGKRFVVGSAAHEGRQVVVFGADDDFQCVFEGETDHGWMRGVGFLDAAGEQVVSTTHDGVVDLWNTRTGGRAWRTKTDQPALNLAVLGARIAVVELERVLFLDARNGAVLDTLDLRALDDVPYSCLADPERKTLWLGTAKGAILRFHVE